MGASCATISSPGLDLFVARCAEMIEHGAPVVRNQNSGFQRGAVEDFRISDAVKFGLLSGYEIDRWLSSPDSLDDYEFEIVVC
jgi:hypothetical protein